MKIASLDSLTDNPINITNARIEGPFPNIRNVAIGFTVSSALSISTVPSITLGGSSTTEMTIRELTLSGDITELKRSKQVQTLRVDTLVLGYNLSTTELDIPFDDLRYLDAGHEWMTRPLKSITLPPSAVNWTGGFELYITNAPDLNLSSAYGSDKQGKTIQTWYWPTNISSIALNNVNVGNGFFDAFVAQQNGSSNSQPAPSVLNYFSVTPSRNSTAFDCTPFIELQRMGRLTSGTDNFHCDNSTSTTSTSNAIPIHGPSSLTILGVVMGIGIWVLAPSLS
ncbi:hypothetical protein N7457_000115 [Penicillium paradoxum]|uniref:uncharacterized protein n=1 Tax=Penicillium paradoxum TaxID=176176 RepID=UPI00254885DC|nr:uncharacterized protein N7457_000115 [Penicillium paradoxum]KAJ5793516.1 hypothetical protein N7457_000115 [Penicillium paradoxum]